MEPVSPPSLLCLVTLCIETGVSCVLSVQRDQTQPSVSNETVLVKSASCPFSCGCFFCRPWLNFVSLGFGNTKKNVASFMTHYSSGCFHLSLTSWRLVNLVACVFRWVIVNIMCVVNRKHREDVLYFLQIVWKQWAAIVIQMLQSKP